MLSQTIILAFLLRSADCSMATDVWLRCVLWLWPRSSAARSLSHKRPGGGLLYIDTQSRSPSSCFSIARPYRAWSTNINMRLVLCTTRNSISALSCLMILFYIYLHSYVSRRQSLELRAPNKLIWLSFSIGLLGIQRLQKIVAYLRFSAAFCGV